MFHVKHSIIKAMEKLSEQQFLLFLKGLQFHNVILSQQQKAQFFSYIELLFEWNQKINLFSKADQLRLAERHLLESIVWTKSAPEIRPPIMDLGSGAGFPGIPIAIFFPDKEIVLVESKKKKAVFLTVVASKLKLQVKIIPERVEELNRTAVYKKNFYCIISRAVADITTLLKWSLPLLHPQGMMLAFKGDSILDEIHQLKQSYSKILNFSVNIIDYTVVKDLATTPREVGRTLIKIQMNEGEFL